MHAELAVVPDRCRSRHRRCAAAVRAVLTLSVFLGGLAGCAANRGAQGPSTNTSLITHEEIESSQQPTLFDVVRALRPMWLRQSSAVLQGKDAGVIVYVDNQRVGGIEALRDMASTTAASLRFYTASEAQSRFGLGNLHGVIEVITPHQTR